MKHLNLNLIGRFGNQIFAYCWARGFCERHGMQLHTHPWVGQKIFELNDPPWERDLPRVTESEVLASVTVPGNENGFQIEGYFQNQRSIDYYTRTKAKEWLRWRPEIISHMPIRAAEYTRMKIDAAFHLRRGDYHQSGYPTISLSSYKKCAKLNGLLNKYRLVSEEEPSRCPILKSEAPFLGDFLDLMLAPILLRANSSFSYWAAVLADNYQRVFSPVVDNAVSGQENDVPWVEGNHPRLANFDFTTELRLAP